jgi:hypothetical protein
MISSPFRAIQSFPIWTRRGECLRGPKENVATASSATTAAAITTATTAIARCTIGQGDPTSANELLVGRAFGFVDSSPGVGAFTG